MTRTARSRRTSPPPAAPLLRLLAQAFDTRSWHGPNLFGSLRGVGSDLASFRPQPERHNIWELTVHAAYWKYRVLRLMPGEPPKSFGIPGSNFFPRPEPDAQAVTSSELATAWEEDLERLRSWHRRLCAAVEELTARQLAERPGKSGFDRWELVTGVASHDIYHAGQIQLLKRLASG